MELEKILKEKMNIISIDEIEANDLKDICYQEVYYDNFDYIAVISEEYKYIGCIFREQVKQKLKDHSFSEMNPESLAAENAVFVGENEDEEALVLIKKGSNIVPIVDKDFYIVGAYRINKVFTNHLDERYSAVIRDEVLLRQSVLYMETSYYQKIESIENAGFQVYSQNDEDGIIQWIIRRIDAPIKNFIEFGVQNYFQSNTRYLHIKDCYSGLIMECNTECVNYILNDLRLKNNLTVGEESITAANINELILKYGFTESQEIGILSIDVDGNDYWIWKSINIINSQIVICEYNTAFGYDRALTIPYDENFCMDRSFINAYFGASIKALELLGEKKGYSLIGCNGTNAFFVRNDLMKKFEKKTSYELKRKYDFWRPRYLKRMRKKPLYVVDQNRYILVDDYLRECSEW